MHHITLTDFDEYSYIVVIPVSFYFIYNIIITIIWLSKVRKGKPINYIKFIIPYPFLSRQLILHEKVIVTHC